MVLGAALLVTGTAVFAAPTQAESTSNQPLTGIARTASGHGYWQAATDGGIFAFGDARFYGSMGGKSLAGAVNAIARTANGDGYWLPAVDGGVFAYGTAGYYGNVAYTLPRPVATTAGQKVADLAIGWKELTWTGINNDHWEAKRYPEYWCADFMTYTWQKAGIGVQHYARVSDVLAWAQRNGRWSTDVRNPHVGDAVIYGDYHVGIVVQLLDNGSVVSADGDFGGIRGQGEAAFAKSAHVVINTWSPVSGDGAAGKITGYVRAS
jgi:hypothetical protein